jgi:hypothetical protein
MRTGCRDIILGASSIALDSVDLQATFCAFVGAVAMTKGYEVRAQIDSENTRGLLLINGGAAVALLAFLPAIFGKPGLDSLVAGTLWAAWLISVRTSVRGYPQPSAPNFAR